jgi:2-dehydropantoate 2-reductase
VRDAAPASDDLVVLATMGHDSEAALTGIDPSVTVACFQNGLAPLEVCARSGRHVIAAMVYLPAERRGPGIVALPAVPVVGTVFVGDWPRGAGRWAAWLAFRLIDAGLRAESEPEMAPWVRAKLLTNLGGIVTALCDLAPDDVIESAQAEARAVWHAAGEPFEEIETLMKRVGPLDLLPVDGRARVGGSTRAAFARGDRLETASLHGPIVDAGRALGVATPVNEALLGLAEEASLGRWNAGAMTPMELRRRVLEKV